MDDQLKSSNHPDDLHPAYEGRLNFPGAWCGNTMQKQLFLQVDFLLNFQGTNELVHSIGIKCFEFSFCTLHEHNIHERHCNILLLRA